MKLPRGQVLHLVAGAAALSSSLLVALAYPVVAQSPGGIGGVLASGVEPELVKEGFARIEGPVGAADGSLYFSDRNPDRTYHLDLSGNVSVFREDTNGANGLAYTRQGEMVTAEGSGNKISRIGRDGKATTLTERYGGKPFGVPNDLIVDAKGGIYFTDPDIAVVGSGAVARNGPTHVFYLPPGATEAIVVDDQTRRPNGLTLTLDGKTLLVDNTADRMVLAFDVQDDGTVKNRRPFIELQDIAVGQSSGADGMAIDRDGRIYVTTLVGIQVFDPAGKYLGRFKAGRQAANIAFAGPDKKTLYLTAREGLYRVRMLSQGPDRLGK